MLEKTMANFAILRIGKIKSAASVKGMLKHNFRTIDTPNADAELTPSNQHVAAKSVDDGMRLYRDRLPDKIRKNAVHAIDYMITTSPEATKEANAACLREGLAWVAEKHGKENIIMASKHNDETTPHMHIVVVPIDEKGKLNARSFIGGSKHRMSDLQDEFINRIQGKGIDLDRGIKGSRAKHQTIKEWNASREAIENTTESQIKAAIADHLTPRKKSFLKESELEATKRALGTVQEFTVKQQSSITALKYENERAKQTLKRNQGLVDQAVKIRGEVSLGKTAELDKLTAKADEKRLSIEAQKERVAKSRSRDNGMER